MSVGSEEGGRVSCVAPLGKNWLRYAHPRISTHTVGVVERNRGCILVGNEQAYDSPGGAGASGLELLGYTPKNVPVTSLGLISPSP